jgi:hypothetical protein
MAWSFKGRELNPYQLEWDALIDAIRKDKLYNEVKRGAEASLVTSMGRMAAHTGQVITFDDMLNCPHEFAPDVAKLAMDESMLRHDVRREIVKNSGDTTWITDAVIRQYTAGQAADISGSIDAFQRMSKSTKPEPLTEHLHQFTGPVRLLLGGVEHPSEIPDEQRELLRDRLTDFAADTIPGSGQFINEEQPKVVVDAVVKLHRAAGE